jgi:hypothetical protein
VLDKNGGPVVVNAHPPTLSGLALALGFSSRGELLARRAASRSRALARAVPRVEEYAESQLFDKGSASGARFALANNFRGWDDAAKDAPCAPPDFCVRVTVCPDDGAEKDAAKNAPPAPESADSSENPAESRDKKA